MYTNFEPRNSYIKQKKIATNNLALCKMSMITVTIGNALRLKVLVNYVVTAFKTNNLSLS